MYSILYITLILLYLKAFALSIGSQHKMVRNWLEIRDPGGALSARGGESFREEVERVLCNGKVGRQ